MKRTSRIGFSIGYVLVSLALLVVLQLVLFPPVQPRAAPYSAFLAALEEKRVARAQIGGSTVLWVERGKEQEPPFLSVRLPGVPDEDLVRHLRESGAEFTGLPERTWLTDVLSWVVPALLLAGVWWLLIGRHLGQQQALSFGRNRAKIYAQGDVSVTFDDVAGVDEAVAELREIVDFLKNRERYTRLGGNVPKGVLLVGPPGTGKTLLAKATAGEAKVPFFSISGSEFVEMFVGVGAARVRDLFQQAQQHAPCIVFIDEIDTIGRQRGGVTSLATNEEREQTLNQLLVEMDGFDSKNGVIIMAATNRPEVLDPALLRPGRFDRQIVIDKPDLRGREAILRLHARRVKLDPAVDLRVIAARTPGFGGAELANVVNEAALLAARRGRDAVTMAELEEAIDRVMAGLERRSRVLTDEERRRVAYHELGHAIVAAVLPHADPVHKVSIVARGVAALGFTQQLPLHDRYLLSAPELHDRLSVMLGGRAAEELVFGTVSTGAHDDLTRATALARRMVTEFGMSEALGPVAFGDGRPRFLRQSLDEVDRLPVSEATATLIDEEVRRIVARDYERARSVLAERREALDVLARELIEREVLDGRTLAARLAELAPGRCSAGAGQEERDHRLVPAGRPS
ncbi:MAG TPA: ATP-dependent zinc metalloprotease FtsH [Chloroflexota bacterium]